ncbi:MAG: hypothetical protein RR338_00170 [Clostridia bacterium]
MDMLTYELATILKKNAPVRDGSKYPGARGDSPYPGNLKNNGIRYIKQGGQSIIAVGNPDAPYAPYTETRSRKRGWQRRSNEEFLALIKSFGGKIERI